MKKISLLLTSALITMAFNANADSGRNYVKLELGAAKAAKFSKADYGHAKPKTNGVGILSFGHNFSNYVAGEVGVTQFSEFKISGRSPSGNSFEQKIDASALMMNVNFNAPRYNYFTPYATFGLGMAYVGADDYLERNSNGILFMQSGKTKINPAYNIGAGVKYDLTNDLSASLGYKFNYLGKSSTSRIFTSSDGTSTSVVKPIRASIKAHSLMVGMAYKF